MKKAIKPSIWFKNRESAYFFFKTLSKTNMPMKPLKSNKITTPFLTREKISLYKFGSNLWDYVL